MDISRLKTIANPPAPPQTGQITETKTLLIECRNCQTRYHPDQRCPVCEFRAKNKYQDAQVRLITLTSILAFFVALMVIIGFPVVSDPVFSREHYSETSYDSYMLYTLPFKVFTFFIASVSSLVVTRRIVKFHQLDPKYASLFEIPAASPLARLTAYGAVAFYFTVNIPHPLLSSLVVLSITFCQSVHLLSTFYASPVRSKHPEKPKPPTLNLPYPERPKNLVRTCINCSHTVPAKTDKCPTCGFLASTARLHFKAQIRLFLLAVTTLVLSLTTFIASLTALPATTVPFLQTISTASFFSTLLIAIFQHSTSNLARFLRSRSYTTKTACRLAAYIAPFLVFLFLPLNLATMTTFALLVTLQTSHALSLTPDPPRKNT